jgi:hypothetical protein
MSWLNAPLSKSELRTLVRNKEIEIEHKRDRINALLKANSDMEMQIADLTQRLLNAQQQLAGERNEWRIAIGRARNETDRARRENNKLTKRRKGNENKDQHGEQSR